MIKSFWQWKQELRAIQSPLVHPKEWYYREYGKYCNKERVQNDVLVYTTKSTKS